MGFFAYYPPSGSSSANASVAPNGGPIPSDSTLVAGENPSGNQQPLQTNASGDLFVEVTSSALPAGSATAANQVLEITALNSIDGKLTSPLTVTGPLTDTQLRATPVPISGTVSTGGLTDGQLRASPVPVSATQSGTWNITNVSGTVSLPTGAATETTLAAISGKLPTTLGPKTQANSFAVTIATDQSTFPVVASLGSAVVTGSAGALNADGIAATDVGLYANLSVQITGTFVGTLSFQGSNDLVAYVSVNALSVSDGVSIVTQATTTTGIFLVPVKFRYFRLRMTAYTSGTAACTMQETAAASNDLGHRSVDISNVSLAVTGPLTDTQLRASAVPVTLTSTTITGTVTVREAGISAATLSNVSASASSVTLLSSNASRVGGMIVNDSASATLLVKYGTTASATSYTYSLLPGATLELPANPAIYTGRIDGIWTAAVGSARVTEL